MRDNAIQFSKTIPVSVHTALARQYQREDRAGMLIQYGYNFIFLECTARFLAAPLPQLLPCQCATASTSYILSPYARLCNSMLVDN